MKKVILLSIILILLSSTACHASITNKIEINSNTGNGEEDIKTNVNIEHSGNIESKSEVTVNGKTYALEGAGSISIENGKDTKNASSSTQTLPSTSPEDVLGSSTNKDLKPNDSSSLLNTIFLFLRLYLKKWLRL